jgi:hypothetical protein
MRSLKFLVQWLRALAQKFLACPRCDVAYRRRGSATDSVPAALLRGEVHLILANPPWRQLQERAQKILGDKKHAEGCSHGVIVPCSSIPHISFLGLPAKYQ